MISLSFTCKELCFRPDGLRTRPSKSSGVASLLRKRLHCRGDPRRKHAIRNSGHPDSLENAVLRESTVERVTYISDEVEFQAACEQAGDKLVVLEVFSDDVCETGLPEEAELHWELDRQAQLKRCSTLRHTLDRIAEECQDIKFLAMLVPKEKNSLCVQLGITVLPSLIFLRNGRKLWEHRGILNLEQELGEGVLYYGDTAANNEKASTYVKELHTGEDLAGWLGAQEEANTLMVVNVSMTICDPCVHIYPSVLALAKGFGSYASFARLIGEDSDEFLQLLGELQIQEVPSFLFYRNGVEVGRYVGSSRGDLIGHILQIQEASGIGPPPPKNPRRRTTRR